MFLVSVDMRVSVSWLCAFAFPCCNSNTGRRAGKLTSLFYELLREGGNNCLLSVIRKIKGLDIPIPGISSPSEFCWAMSE